MTNRERVLAVLNYGSYDRLPVVHFGFWCETLEKWAKEGHITDEVAGEWGDGNPTDAQLSKTLGFDLNYYSAYHPFTFLRPEFGKETVEELPDGSKKVRNEFGMLELVRTGATSIPAEIDHLLKTRADWEEHYKHRLQFEWNASIAPWRARYGRELRGVGGMNKAVFTRDFAAVDAEIERLKPLVDLGGYLPCPDHRIAPDSHWDNVRYYCDRMHEEFS